MEWRENASRVHTFIKDVSPMPPGIIKSYTFIKDVSPMHPGQRVKLNGLGAGVVLFGSETHR